MLIRRLVTNCDFTGTRYDSPVAGAAFIARGASGRYCEVMWAGPEYLDEHPDQKAAMMSRAAARAEIEARGDGYPDF